MRLASAWHKIRDPVAIDAFMRTCLIRCYLREQRRPWHKHENTVADVPDVAATDPTDRQVRGMVIAQVMRSVPPKRRAILICRFYWDLDVNATAQVVGCSPGTVKSQTARALDNLRSSGLVHPDWNEGQP